MRVTTIELAGLTTHVVGPADASTTVVLLHGFGAPGTDLVPLANAIASPGSAPRFVFPEAPLELDRFSRAWWLLDLEALEAELARGQPRDRRTEIPDGLPSARA